MRREGRIGWNSELASYSVFDSTSVRMHSAKWLFPQEKASLHDFGDVNKRIENALACAQAHIREFAKTPPERSLDGAFAGAEHLNW